MSDPTSTWSRPGRIPLAEFRVLLPAKYSKLSDEEVFALQDRLYDLAELAIEATPMNLEESN